MSKSRNLTKDNAIFHLRLQILQFQQNKTTNDSFFSSPAFCIIILNLREYFTVMRFSFFCLILFLSPFGLLFSQEIVSLNIDWQQSELFLYNEKELKRPVITGQDYDHGVPSFYWTSNLKSSNYQVELKSFQLVPAPVEDVKYFQNLDISFTESLYNELKVTKSMGESQLVFYMQPYVFKNGVLNRITAVELEVKEANNINSVEKDFVSNSALSVGSGDWYKIAVTKDGVYKIDNAFLESCGIQTSGLNPNHINIYGNGDGMLPELNSEYRTDDLAKNSIQIVGGGDGSFDDGDYILFYAWGPDRWHANGSSSFDRQKNVYSDVSCYFININANETPERIIPAATVGSLPTHTINTYSYFDIYEYDDVNLVKGGQRWYGELFDIELEQTFSFNVPNIVSTYPSSFNTSIATNARSTSGTEQKYTLNNTVLGAFSLPSVSSDYVTSQKSHTFNTGSSALNFKITITRNSPSTLVYLDRITLNTRRSLNFYGQQLNFRDLSTIGVGTVGEFELSAFPSTGFVWDITDRHHPFLIQGENTTGLFRFKSELDSLKEFVASNGVSFLTPSFVGYVLNQNLHGLEQADYLIITHPDFIVQANRLAQLHETNGLSVHLVTTEQVYNEYSSGMLDPTALKMFAKMFYDRAAGNQQLMPKYLLLFGDATYDPKNRVANNNYFVPTYEFPNGENHISAMVADDYFGMLDDNESIGPSDLLDIGVGRLLISDNQMAKEQVDKIEHYLKNGSNLFISANTGNSCDISNGTLSTFGDWRLKFVQIADDEEGGYFVQQDTEPQYLEVKTNHPEMNCDKLYSDAYTQETSAGGQRYPDVFEAITDRVENGALVVNYVGHGGEVGLAEERIVTVPQIQDWKNINRLNLFVSATCEFTKFDDPNRVSAGEWVSLNPLGGAIALMTTTRSVFFGVNTITGKKFFENVFERDSENEPLSFGEIMRLTKNASGSSENKRSFTLIGDPALKLALPRYRIVTDSINGIHPALASDTVRALSKMTIKGHLEDWNGNVLNNFNGILSPSIFDKIKTKYTLGQDPDSPEIPFELQKNVVYKGQSSVSNGYFEFSFVVPKDIDFSFGNGKISYYAANSLIDAGGSDNRFVIGGIDPNGINDVVGPEIDLFMNDENFVDGGITNESPIILAHLFDENGINTVGNGIGHDLTAVLDENTSNPIVLNTYYTADLDSYQSGKLSYQLPTLDKGIHTLSLKVWDVNNNSSEAKIEFVVQEATDIVLDHVLNYPNPFTTNTSFYFEHNQICSDLEVQVQILTVSGKLVRTINQNVKTEGFRSEGIPWDGRDEFGDQLAKGVYVYTLKVKSHDGKIAEKSEKLVLLK